MNSVLLDSNEIYEVSDITAEIKEMVKNIEELKSGIDMFGEIVKKQISTDTV